MMKISLEQRHIDKGGKGFDDCPAALAIVEAIDWRYPVLVSLESVYVGSAHIRSPRSLRRFIKRYDNKKKVKPFNFMLDIEP